MYFDVDPARLGAPIQDSVYHVQFQPPVGWKPFSTGEMSAVQEGFAQRLKEVSIVPRYIFRDSASQSTLMVAGVHLPGGGPSQERVNRYAGMLHASFGGDTLQQDMFLKQGMRVTQFYAQTHGRINFLLVCTTPTDSLLQFDYLIPRQHYLSALKALESSIGSIQALNSF